MATGKGYFGRFNHRFLPGDRDHQEYGVSSDSEFELSESDLFNSARSDSPECRKPAKKPTVKRFDSSDQVGRIPSSLPVNVPDWSKILRDEYTENQRRAISDEEDGGSGEDEGEARIPPHEFLAGKRIASFSVQEGIGRTLKGRDLSRVRNAIWEKIGFQD